MDKVKFLERQYKRNLSRIVGLCYRYVNDFTVAEDLAQDVFLKAMENLTAPRAIFNFDHWLTRIAVNHCIDYLRQQPDFAPLPLESIAESASMEDCRDAISRVSTVVFSEKEILETIQQLPELQRTVFNLYAIERYSHRRIAGVLGISVDNSKQLHHRARVRLAKMLTDKQKEKDDKKKGLIMALLFFSQIRTYANGRRIDRLYRSKLSGLRIDPTVVGANHYSPLRNTVKITQTATSSSGKIGMVLAAHKTAVLVVAATGIAGGAVAWQAVHDEPTGMETEDVAIVETVCTLSSQNETAPTQDVNVIIPVVGANHYSPLKAETVTHPVVETRLIASLQTEPTNVPVSDTLPEPPSVTKTIVIRDTVTVHDTILQMQDHD